MGRTGTKEPQIDRLEPPTSAPLIRVMAMPADANPNGDIFGGWLLAQMDLAGGNLAVPRGRDRGATVAINLKCSRYRHSVDPLFMVKIASDRRHPAGHMPCRSTTVQEAATCPLSHRAPSRPRHIKRRTTRGQQWMRVI